MKNMILGAVGCLILIYGLVIALSISAVTEQKSRMENAVSSAMYSVMKAYYVPEILRERTAWGAQTVLKYTDEYVEQQLTDEIRTRLGGGNHLQTDIRICDMEKGILSLEVSEEISLPTGTEKTITCCRTILADRTAE